MKIVAFICEQRRLLLRRALAIPNGYLQNPIVTAFVTKIVEHMESVFRVLRDDPKTQGRERAFYESLCFRRQSKGRATPSLIDCVEGDDCASSRYSKSD